MEPARQLSEHLSEAEFTSTQHRELLADQQLAWDGAPLVRASAQEFAEQLFEEARDVAESPLHVTSGFRCALLNRAVGGRPGSHHVLGRAVDVIPVSVPLEVAFARIRAAVAAGKLLVLDEAIIECGTWIHLQTAARGLPPRRAVMESRDGIHFAFSR